MRKYWLFGSPKNFILSFKPPKFRKKIDFRGCPDQHRFLDSNYEPLFGASKPILAAIGPNLVPTWPPRGGPQGGVPMAFFRPAKQSRDIFRQTSSFGPFSFDLCGLETLILDLFWQLGSSAIGLQVSILDRFRIDFGANTKLSWSTTSHKNHVVKVYKGAGVHGGLRQCVGSKSAEGTRFRSTPSQVLTRHAV